jgi:hypothetical protein
VRALAAPVAIAALCVAPLWLAPVVPTTDGPAHLYNAWLLLHFDDPGLEAGRLLQVNAFVPNWGGVGPLVPLLLFLPPAVAEKVFLSAIVALLVLATAVLTSRLGGDPFLAAASAGVLAHGWLLAAGFTAFLAALALGTAVWAGGVRLLEPAEGRVPWARAGATGLAFGLLFFVHLAGAVLAAAVWLLLFAGRSWTRPSPRRALALGATPLVPLAVLVAVHWARGQQHPIPPFRAGPGPGWGRLLELGTGAYWQAYSPLDRPIGVALTLLTLALIAARATGQGRSAPGARWLALGGAGALVAYLVVPWAAAGGAFLTDRLVPLVFLLPLAWATSPGLPARALFRTALAVLLVGALAHRTAQYRYWGAITSSVVRLNRDLAEGRVLVQPPLPPLPMAVDPLVHVWGRVAIDRRAMALDNYEALLVGWFPLSFRPEGMALVSAWRNRGSPPPGAVVLRFR